VILFIAAWDPSGSLRGRLADAVTHVAAAFPPVAGAAVELTAWDGPTTVGWVASEALNADVLVEDDRVAIVEGVALSQHRGAVSAADVASLSTAELDELDGQYVVVNASAHRLQLRTDLLGMRPVYCARRGPAWLIANRVELLARVLGGAALDLDSAACFLSVGWVPGDGTLATGVRTVLGGQHWSWSPEGIEQRALHHPASFASRRSRRLDVDALAAELASGCRAAAARSSTVEAPITAGLDSRLVLALLRHAGIDVACFTSGSGETEDTRAGRAIAALAGVPHHVRPVDGDQVCASWTDRATATIAQNDGLVSLWQIADSLHVEPRRLHVSGIGGEVGRGRFTRPAHFVPVPDERAVERLAGERATSRSGIVHASAVATARAAVRSCAEDALAWGFRRSELGDALYTFWRAARSSGANARKVPDSNQFAPLATRQFVEAAFSLTAARRYSSPLHHALLERLAPDLHAYPVSGGGWRSQVPYVNFAQQALRKSLGAGSSPHTYAQVSWLEVLREQLAVQCLDDATSPVWELVDRARFEAVMLDADAVAARGRAAQAIYGAVTMFEYARVRAR
jgi:hypothetical protein